MQEALNPGSDEARKAGCTCPVMDNAHGRGERRGWQHSLCLQLRLPGTCL